MYSTDAVEREIWIEILQQSLEVHKKDQQQQAIMIANQVGRMFK
jgi:hypothetical protein